MIRIRFLLTNDKTASKEDRNPKELKLEMCARVCAKQKGEHLVPVLSPKPEINSPSYSYDFNVLNGIAGHAAGDTGVQANMEMFLDDGFTTIVLTNYGSAMKPVSTKMNSLVLAGKNEKAASQ